MSFGIILAMMFAAVAQKGALKNTDYVVVSTEEHPTHEQATNIARSVSAATTNELGGRITSVESSVLSLDERIGSAEELAEVANENADAALSTASSAEGKADRNAESIEGLDAKVDGTLAFVFGDDVNLVVTNYFGTKDYPRLQVRQRVSDGGTNYWKYVWDEMTRWNAFNLVYDAFTNSVVEEFSSKADRAFGYYDSHTGDVAPDNFLSVSAKNVLLGGGGSFQKVITSGGDFFIATSSDPTVYSATTNGFFKLMDGDGTPLFEYVRGDKTLAWGKAGSFITEVIDGLTHVFVSYPIEATEHPILEVSTSLEGGGVWIAEDDASCPINVVWSGSSGNWQAEVSSKTASHPALFIKASYYEGGDSYIKPTVAQGLNKVIVNGITYTVKVVEINGTKVLALE